MKLPNAGYAVVPYDKIVNYLPSFNHEDGKSKAEFFTRFGFRVDEWETLANALVTHAEENDLSRTERSTFGVRYVVEGIMSCPDGRTPEVRSVWFVADGESVPRFVTAYRLKRSSR